MSHLCRSVAIEFHFFDAVGEVARSRRDGGPESESSIEMHPRARLPRARRDLRDGIESTRIHVPRLETDDRGPFEKTLLESIGSHASLVIDGHRRDPAAAEAEQAEGLQKRRVNFGAHDDANLRRTEEALRSTSHPAREST